jgi:phage terminase small subunit
LTRALARRKDDWGALGPAMKALPSARWRAFVEFYLLEPPGYGAQTRAARRAGFGHANSKPLTMARIATRLLHDDRILAAIAEESRKLLRAGAPEAVKALLGLVRNPDHRDHARGIALVLARTDPEVARHDVNVVHRIVDPDIEALEELRALRHVGTPRDKLLELFGGNGLARLEKLEAEDNARRADKATIVDDVEYEDVTEPQGD